MCLRWFCRALRVAGLRRVEPILRGVLRVDYNQNGWKAPAIKGGQRNVILKSQQTNPGDIELATKRLDEWENGQNI